MAGGVALIVKTLCSLCLTLCARALAGGSEPPVQITSDSVLQGLTGVTVTEAPTGNFEVDSARWRSGVGYTYAVQVRVGTQRVRVLLSPGAIEDSSTVNTLRAYVDTPSAAAAQRQALVRLARGFLQACAPHLSGQAQSVWAGLTRYNWAGALGWQDRLLGSVRVGWSGREGMSVGDRNVTGIAVTWSRSSGRCVF